MLVTVRALRVLKLYELSCSQHRSAQHCLKSLNRENHNDLFRLRDQQVTRSLKRFNSLKACLWWKVHLAYPASLQALHSNTYKQIIQIQHNRIKNPNWQEATSWLFYKRGRGFELRTTENKSSQWPERDSNPGPPDCETDAKTTWPRCLS